MIHIYAYISNNYGFIRYHAQDHKAGKCSKVHTDPSKLKLEFNTSPKTNYWTLVCVVPSLPINKSQYPELFL